MSSNLQSTPPAGALAAGYRFNEFEISEAIGGGGFGIVYRAWDHQLERTVAIKEYMPATLASRNADGSLQPRSERQQKLYQAGLTSFIQEARLLARFNHPGLLNVLRFWEQNGTAYMVTLFYSGSSLKALQLNDPARISEAWIRQLLPPLFSAIATLHQEGYLHRDISLDNIQIQDNDQPVLLDFGSARKEIGNLEDETEIMLKPGYAPIEQYSEEGEREQGPWTDIYALGAVLHTLIAGSPPPVSVVRCIEDRYPPLTDRRPAGWSLPLLYAVDQALAMAPGERPQSLEQLAALIALPEAEVEARLQRANLTSSALPASMVTAESSAGTDVVAGAAPAAIPAADIAAQPAAASAGLTPAAAQPASVAINHAAAAAAPVTQAATPRRLSPALLGLSLLSLAAVAGVVWMLNRDDAPVAAAQGSAVATPAAPAASLATVYLRLNSGESLLVNGKVQAVKADSDGLAVLNLAAGSWQLQVKSAGGVRQQQLTIDRAGTWLVNPQP
ncbi:serine/threonine-protein kinase [Erwinia sp. Leaf53]|uniref:serine/threonine protein kinase n=1 Tax=Erwinia sp. Leaf53 TaxID=1736225 RepID=UPI000701126F|nr:serine/threonine-protein kinase [Erwinia sp. Leaf53]KQN61810.1 nuclease PIN [Erwinia sp. Leaf53]